MLENYLKIAWRHLYKNKVFSAINIFGLSLGIASALLIIFHVKDELNFDQGYPKTGSIFRVTLEGMGEDSRHWAATSYPIGPSMQQDLPSIKKVVRFHRPYPYQVLSYTSPKGDVKKFEEKGGLFADASSTDVFDLQFVSGNAKTALLDMDAIVLSEEMAHKYFGNEDPLNKVIQDDLHKLPLRVTGVFRSFSFNSHLRFDYLLSMTTIHHYLDEQSLENRTWNGFYTYVQINGAQSKKELEANFPDFLAKFYEKTGETRQQVLSTRKLHLQPIADIHLHSKLEKELYSNSDITYVYTFSIAALFILLVAAVNFVNISTAQAFNRMKEIGLRKVIGANRMQLVRQFLGESFLIVFLATVVALLLFRLAIPLYNDLTGKHFYFEQVLTLPNIIMLFLLLVTIGILSGLYPAWFVANFNPISSLKGKGERQSSVNMVRKGLIVFQFVVSVFMIFSTVIIYRQLRLFHNKDLGFDKEQLVGITIYSDMWNRFEELSRSIQQSKAISGFAIVSTLPGERFSSQSFTPLSASGNVDLPGARVMWSDENMLPTLRIAVKDGRNFFNQNPRFPEVKRKEFLINEAAVKAFHLANPVGKKFILDRDTGDIVGVVKNFNFASLHSPVEPLVIQYNPFRCNYLLLRIQPGSLKETLKIIESNVKRLSPSSVFNYTFIDDKLDSLYESESRMSVVFGAFAAIAIFISALGLFGLSAYAIRLRAREVGIRKVLGASVSNVTLLLSRDFLKLVLLATLISWPLAWWAMNQWLDGFAYRVSIGLWVFAISGTCAALAGLLTVSFQAIRTALLNPVKSLKID